MADVKDVIASTIAVSRKKKITSSMSLIEDLGADSLDKIELCMAIEDEFDIGIPDHEWDQLKTVHDIEKYVSEHK